MSQENVDLINRSFKVFQSGDVEESVRTFAHRDIEFVSRFGEMDGRTYRGMEEIRRYIADMEDTWERYERRLERLIDAGEAVVAILSIRAVSRATGLEVEQRVGLVYWLREGLIQRMVSFPDVDTALEAVGLSE